MILTLFLKIKTITLTNDTTYRSILEPLGIDVVLSPQTITVSRILSYIRKGKIRQVYSLREGDGEVIEADALESSSIVNKKISELYLPIGRWTIFDDDPISKWSIGSDYEEKDGFYLSRSFDRFC